MVISCTCTNHTNPEDLDKTHTGKLHRRRSGAGTEPQPHCCKRLCVTPSQVRMSPSDFWIKCDGAAQQNNEWHLCQKMASVLLITVPEDQLSHRSSSNNLDCSPLILLLPQKFQTVGSCEAGSPRRGPKNERRDSMIHKTE